MSRPQGWDAWWAGVGSEAWLAARAVLEADERLTVGRDAWLFLNRPDAMQGDGPWVRWIESVEGPDGPGWSSTERRQFEIVSALVADRPVVLRNLLDYLGSWEAAILAALVDYGSGGNNREHPGRLKVTPR